LAKKEADLAEGAAREKNLQAELEVAQDGADLAFTDPRLESRVKWPEIELDTKEVPSRGKHGERFLAFETCGGLTNQRIALIQGFMIAHITSRVVLLPYMNVNGAQMPELDYQEDRTTMLGFNDTFDLPKVASDLQRLGIQLTRFEDNTVQLFAAYKRAPVVHVNNNPQTPSWFRSISDTTTLKRRSTLKTFDVLRLDCAFFSLEMRNNGDLRDLYWAISSSLQPVPWIAKLADQVIENLQKRSVERGGSGTFNALHIRAEGDWMQHCQKWEPADVWARSPQINCKSNTDRVSNVLSIEGISNLQPLFIAGSPLGSELDAVRHPLSHLRQYYDIVDKHSFLKQLPSYERARELLAMIDFRICSAAAVFVGNSVSTFGAHLLLERQYKQNALMKYNFFTVQNVSPFLSVQYNGRCIPLSEVLFGSQKPFGFRVQIPTGVAGLAKQYGCYAERYPDILHMACHGNIAICDWQALANHYHGLGKREGRTLDCDMLKIAGPTIDASPLRMWVFTITLSGDPEYHEMAKVAVVSARKHTSLQPVCVVFGEYREHQMIQWLKSQGARVIFHEPRWANFMLEATENAKRRGYQNSKSPLYADPEKLVATFLRLDISTLGFVDDYVLYTDVDVLFTGNVDLNQFGATLPRYFTMGTEYEGADLTRYSGNMGILLINVREMQRTHAEFIRWVFSAENINNGLFFGDFGPGDQGAMKAFYENKFLLRAWPSFNWKPYWGFVHIASIIHFHGPKPRDYARYAADKQEELKRHPIYKDIYKECNMAMKGLKRIMSLWHSYLEELGPSKRETMIMRMVHTKPLRLGATPTTVGIVVSTDNNVLMLYVIMSVATTICITRLVPIGRPRARAAKCSTCIQLTIAVIVVLPLCSTIAMMMVVHQRDH